VPKEELVAGLLVFRMLYFFLPFCLALLAMACWESALFLRRVAAAGRVRTTAISQKQPCRAAIEGKSSCG